MSKPLTLSIALSIILVLSWTRATATTLLPMPLQRMVAAADVIFHGRVLENKVELDEKSGQVATFTKFEVIQVAKGDPDQIVTIKQIGGELPDAKIKMKIHGVPQFEANREYVVFVPKASRLGFSSPVGLWQGKFDIRELDGQTIVSNGRRISALTQPDARETIASMPAAIITAPSPALKSIPGQPASARLPDFLQTVRKMAQE